MRPADDRNEDHGERPGEGARRDFRRDVDAIRDDLTLLKSDLVAAMQDLISGGREGSGEARERLEKIIQERLDALNSRAEEMSERGRDILEDVQKRAQEQPLQTLAIAFGVGFIAGVFFTRK